MIGDDRQFTITVSGPRVAATLTRLTAEAAISEATRLKADGIVQIEDPKGAVYVPNTFDRLGARWNRR